MNEKEINLQINIIKDLVGLAEILDEEKYKLYKMSSASNLIKLGEKFEEATILLIKLYNLLYDWRSENVRK